MSLAYIIQKIDLDINSKQAQVWDLNTKLITFGMVQIQNKWN